MRISFLCSESNISKLFKDSILTSLANFGEVVRSDSQFESREHAAIIADADVVITSWATPIMSADLLAAAPNLQLIIHAAGSIKPLLDAEQTIFARGIRLASSAVCLSEGVSEMALAFTLTGIKDIYAQNRHISTGGWREALGRVNDPYDLTIGVIGCGYAGAHYIELLQPFRMNVLVYDPHVPDEKLQRLGATRVELEELLRRSDVVSLHAAAIPETEKMINRETLNLMKTTAILINTARGILIDEDDLADHLSAGKLKYAMLDVTWPEPPPLNHRLRQIENCIMTPHIAGLATNGLYKIGQHVYEELARFRAGEVLHSEITPEMVAKMA